MNTMKRFTPLILPSMLMVLLSFNILFSDTKVGNTIPQDRLPNFYAEWFKNPYEYMFSPRGESIELFGNSITQLQAGIGGIVHYGSLEECAMNYNTTYLGANQQRRNWGSVAAIEQMAGIPSILDPGTYETFAHYNPAIIQWGIDNLIPDPSDYMQRYSFQEIYDVVFQRFFRLMTASYLRLESMGYEAELHRFSQAMEQEDFDGYTWQDTQYAHELTQYALPANGTSWTVPMSFGFWLRRGLDSTKDKLWNGLQKVMKLYDPIWFDELDQLPPISTSELYNNTQCETAGYIQETQSYISVYAEPNFDATLLVQVPSNACEAFVSLSIVESQDGWLRISSMDCFDGEIMEFKRDAWVWGRLIKTSVRGYSGSAPVYAEPNYSFAALGHVVSEQACPILACHNGWILTEAEDINNETIRAWLPIEEQCPNAVTTCP